MSNEPLVSCLCITHQRVDLLKRAIDCFRNQSYDNRELLIIYEDLDIETADYVEKITNPQIFLLKVKSALKLTLGDLRNMSIRKCNGTYFCQWDDDDWYKDNRIEYQMKILKKTNLGCSILSHWLVYDCQERKTYLSGFRSWEGSVLCKKSLIKNETKYLSTSKGEDTSLIMYLIRKGQVASTFYPSLYIYVYHGANVWDREHWSGIMKLGNQLSTEFSKMIGNILEGRYSHNKASELLDQHLLFDPDV